MTQKGAVSERPPSCSCGWKRPIIALGTISGKPPPSDVVPILVCPTCGNVHTPGEIPIEQAAAIVLRFTEEIDEINAHGEHFD